MNINCGLFPTPSIPPLSMASTSINQAPLVACESVVNPINPPIEPIKDPVIVPTSYQHSSSKKKCNQSANEHHKMHHAQDKNHNSILQKSLPSLDTTMHDVLEEVVANNNVKMHD